MPVTAHLDPVESFTLVATVWPTTPEKGRQGIISCTGDAGVHFRLDEAGCVCLEMQGAEDGVVSTGEPLKGRRWYRVWAAYDGETGEASVGHLALDRSSGPVRVTRNIKPKQPVMIDGAIFIAALGGDTIREHFNGKIEGPAIYSETLELGEAVPTSANGCVARWDFSKGISSLLIEDTGPNRLHGEIVNLPARGMTGSTWRGQEMCWRHRA